MELDRKSGIPFYIQLKESIRQEILKGVWGTGTRLPTERELARDLGVSRNTVSQAYRELELEGVLKSSQGRGTFVADGAIVTQQESRKEKVLKIIDMAMEEAVGLGFTLDEFISFAHVRGMEKKELLSRIKVGFVECNPEQLANYHWQLGPGVNILPFLLPAPEEAAGRIREQLSMMDVVVTGEMHVGEVKSLLHGIPVAILGLALQPKVETVVRIAKLTARRDLALVCQSRRFGEKVREALEKAGLRLGMEVYLWPAAQLKEHLPRHEAVIVAPGLRPVVERVLPEHMELIEFCFEPDIGSLNFLRSSLLELKSDRIKALDGRG